MQLSKRQSRRRLRNRVLLIGGIVAAAAGGWWYFGTPAEPAPTEPVLALDKPVEPARPAPVKTTKGPQTRKPEAKLAADEEVIKPADETKTPVMVVRAEPEAAASQPAGAPQEGTGAAVVPPPKGDAASSAELEKIRRLHAGGKVIEARHQLNALLSRPLPESEAAEARALLARIADETVFGRRRIPDDPVVEEYTVSTGDVLINIGKKYDVPAEALMLVNDISDPRRIRVNQQLKVVRGPFHARISKSKFRMDLYLGELYVRSYPVGLGTNGGTPEGVWKVKERLENPTYYPPASSPYKQIVAANDPNNPLGENWIGLEGIEGAAVGHEGYGIHGTIEPDSIGKAASLGCVRMRNEDVAVVYKLLLPGRSTVTILP